MPSRSPINLFLGEVAVEPQNQHALFAFGRDTPQ